MQTYLVGGAVRDGLLNRVVTERDYVVVGATPQQMIDKGFTQVGKDFPVFLHPKTKEEYALARTERKQGHGYKGFECDASPDITLEQDLLRRDLTVNAMAMDDAGNIVDPFNGQVDLKNRVLRHVSEAFAEDPLRVLRVARFAARYSALGFHIHNETLDLMRDICASRELQYLNAQRVWQETAKSLREDHPDVYFTTLKSVGALSHWFPELEQLWGIPNPSKWHPEIDTGVHTMMVLQQAVALSDELPVRFAALVHDLGKALTDTTQWPAHHGHDDLGLSAINQFCDRLGVPNHAHELGLLVSEHHSVVHRMFEKSAEDILRVYDKSDAWRRPERFIQMLLVCKCDFLGRKNFTNRPYPQYDYWISLLEELNAVDVKAIVKQGLRGPQIKDAVHHQRLRIIADFISKIHLEHTKN
ncbi:multifunctional CCA addition/repair protein [Glaciecola sp. SC05]|uniref:multifunctional CCA addition/repair protein n=1 Tax=Glaciecola sp. SC05 TaxID=1987355 RepID=UPI00352963E4